MLDSTKIKPFVDTIGSELDLTNKELNFKLTNPARLQAFLDEHQDTDNVHAQKAMAELADILAAHAKLDCPLTKDDLKTVYTFLQERKIDPAGDFDSSGRFYLEDDELVSVRLPSRRWPYSQLTAGRTLKFVKAMAEKYKPQSINEFLTVFHKDYKHLGFFSENYPYPPKD